MVAIVYLGTNLLSLNERHFSTCFCTLQNHFLINLLTSNTVAKKILIILSLDNSTAKLVASNFGSQAIWPLYQLLKLWNQTILPFLVANFDILITQFRVLFTFFVKHVTHSWASVGSNCIIRRLCYVSNPFCLHLACKMRKISGHCIWICVTRNNSDSFSCVFNSHQYGGVVAYLLKLSKYP